MVQHASFDLPGGPAAPRAARQTITDQLHAQLTERDLFDAQLVVSELVTNSVQQCGAGLGEDVVLDVLLVRDRLRLAVVASGAKQPRQVVGRAGLSWPVAERLSSSCGVAIDGCGVTRFWSELTLCPRGEDYAPGGSTRANSLRTIA
jgi:anti-sigma regulatory factor (Ser/Thr protein kinase)